MAAQAPVCDFGWKAPGFTLRATDGRTYSLSDLKGENGTLIMFICNHCPYVKAVIDRIVRDARELEKFGVNSAAICSNDAASYPEDSFENMRVVASQMASPFPISTMTLNEWHGPTERSALPSSSASMTNWNCSIEDGWMRAGWSPRDQEPSVSFSRR